jgi:hypothetical protein
VNRVLRILRTIHSWLGAFVMPWVVVIGLTGFYLNHPKAFDGLIGIGGMDESGLGELKPDAPVTPESVHAFAKTVWPDEPIQEMGRGTFRDWPSIIAKKDRGLIIVSVRTGHYYLKSEDGLRTYAPGGELLHTEYNWERVLRGLHERGWFGQAMGTWFADIVALAMVFFGLSGLFMWSVPKVRWLRRRLSA